MGKNKVSIRGTPFFLQIHLDYSQRHPLWTSTEPEIVKSVKALSLSLEK